MLQEFKKFALGGNVVDLAVGVIIGAALGRHEGAAGGEAAFADQQEGVQSCSAMSCAMVLKMRRSGAL